MQKPVAHRGVGRPRTRSAPVVAEVPVPAYVRARNKTEQILVHAWDYLGEKSNKAVK